MRMRKYTLAVLMLLTAATIATGWLTEAAGSRFIAYARLYSNRKLVYSILQALPRSGILLMIRSYREMRCERNCLC
jgi:hypothetical protein